jgi:cytochrome c-type biogenesis protein CcmH/NrfG
VSGQLFISRFIPNPFLSGSLILVSIASTIAWKLKSAIDDGEVRAYKGQVDFAKQREAYAKEKQDELEKQVADLRAKIAANASRAEVDESFGKVSVALEEAKVANNAVNYLPQYARCACRRNGTGHC